jgi:hypothetical protein
MPISGKPEIGGASPESSHRRRLLLDSGFPRYTLFTSTVAVARRSAATEHKA